MGAIKVTGLGKAYKQYPSRWSRVFEWMDPRGRPHHRLAWVLQDVSFEIKPGEAIGVIGVNGAGKSTLLKMITVTTQPTTGNVQVTGRVAALLELGMGFHPDFTGRQNVFMAGQLSGLSEDEIKSLIPAIEAFADVGEYFDKPIRIYSSGMQARVAFAAATAITPDILIVDEALSVGDMAFQAKCMHRMQTLLEQGTTVLFVSHALNQVRQFCSKALYLSDGHLKAWGPADEVCDLYQNDLTGASTYEESRKNTEHDVEESRYDNERNPDLRKNSVGGAGGGTLGLEFLNFRVLDGRNAVTSACRTGETLKFQAVIQANGEIEPGACVGLLIADKSGYPLMACNTNYYDKFLPEMRAGDTAVVEWKVRIPFALGEFRVDIGLKPSPFSEVFYDRVFCAQVFSVIPDSTLLKRNFGGYLFEEVDVDMRVDSLAKTA